MSVKLFRASVVICLCLQLQQAWAQQGIIDTTVNLPGVEITEERVNVFGTGHVFEKIDSMALLEGGTQSLADLLQHTHLAMIRTNGPGGVASVSLRGTSASHTSVDWNGFNIQSPMNGGVDLSLIPLGASDRISIEYGGSGALQGSGVVGGSIHLLRDAGFNTGWSVQAGSSAASFDNYSGHMVVEYGGSKSFTTLRAYGHSVRNDFPYINTTLAGAPVVKQEHAGIRQWGASLGQDVRLSKRDVLSADVLFTQSYREIPPLMTQVPHVAFLDDRNLYSRLEWKSQFKKVSLHLRGGLVNVGQHYVDSLTAIDAQNDFYGLVAEAEARWALGKGHLLNVGAYNNYEQINTDNYLEGGAHRNRTALFTSYKYTAPLGRLEVAISLREEFSGQAWLYPVPSAGLDWKWLKSLRIRASASRVYRLPTFNDLFWNPGGNLELEPESGWSEEIGLSFAKTFQHFSLDVSATGYNANINNWIIWLPASGWWTPRNVTRVWSRGVESSVITDWTLGNWNLSLTARYHYTRASNQIPISPSDASVGKQLIYVPLHTAFGQCQIQFKSFYATCRYSFLGERYLSSDNVSSLPVVHLTGISISKSLKLKSTKLFLEFKVDNIGDVQWQSVAWMPMPGRSYTLNVNVQFNKP